MFQVPYTARQQYFAAQAEARAAQARAEAAQAEYLAQEALLQEEAALKARLYELEQRKRYTSFTPGPSPFDKYANPQYPLADAQASFSPYGLRFPGHQSSAYANLFELEQWQKRQSLERLRMEAEQDRLRNEYEAQLAARAELERKKKVAKATEAATARVTDHGCHRFAFTPRQGAGLPCLHPNLRAAAQPNKQRTSQPLNRPVPSVTIDEDELKHLFAGLFGVPHHVPTPRSQAASKAPSPPSSASATQPQVKAISTQKPQASGESLVDQLKARYKIDNDEEIKETVLAVLDSLSEPPAPVEPAPFKTPSVEASLLEHLQARAVSEEDQELRDTIQATLNSLLPEFNAPSASVASSSHSRSSSKAKAEPAPPRPTTPSVESRLEEIHRIEGEFHKFESDFVFPSQLDFVSSSNTSATALAHLAFTARNHPVRFYEQALGSLLTELDSIESQGDPALRSKRKEVVSLVERALETLDEQIMGRWNASKVKEASTGAITSFSVPILDVNVSKEESFDSVTSVEATPAHPSESSAAPEEVPVGVLRSAVEEHQQFDDVSLSNEQTSTEDTVPSPQQDLKTLPDVDSEELAQFEDASPSESQLTVKPQDAIVDSATATHALATVPDDSKPVADPEEVDSNDGFLLTQADPEGDQRKLPNHTSNAKVDDLGSDWSDLDA